MFFTRIASVALFNAIFTLVKPYIPPYIQTVDFPYSSFENFEIFSRQLKEKAFSICHLNIRSLSKNIDKLRVPNFFEW